MLLAFYMIPLSGQLVRMPRKVDVQRWNKEGTRRGGHEVHKTIVVRHEMHDDMKGEDIRMISCHGMHKNNLIFLLVEIAGSRPSKMGYLVDEGSLTDDGANQVN